ncbi:hypothetical protein D3C74_50110 [compost metagenome]
MEEDSFTAQDLHREIVARKVKLDSMATKFKREKNLDGQRNAVCRLDELRRTEKIILTLSPGCDQCVDGVITEPAMKTIDKKMGLTVISYNCPYCSNTKGERKQ